jgi:hypothetical protein
VEIPERGWKLRCVWLLVVGRNEHRRTYTYRTREEAVREGYRMLDEAGWDWATIYQKETFK